MNKTELQKILLERNVPADAFSLSGGLPSEKYVLDSGEEKWAVYYSERGQRTGEKTFTTQEAACCYLLEILSKRFLSTP